QGIPLPHVPRGHQRALPRHSGHRLGRQFRRPRHASPGHRRLPPVPHARRARRRV
ncbi:hypothetical protein BN1708_019113, partial [Verticillium longisporum]